ncbi:MAG: DUF6318 family protein [Brachybacterium sp.]|uniref:DUF6318 family protein n=1 Tax=Brachybacterium sp. TaxID=1891286 RepID=UPI003F917847
MHRRLLSAAATSTLLLGLSACSEPTDGPVTTPPPNIDIGAPSDGGGDAEPSDGDGEKTAEPTAEAPDIPPPDPADYAGMDEHTAEGAEQAFKYYIAVSVWAHQTGKDDPPIALQDAKCDGCNSFNGDIPELRSKDLLWSTSDISEVKASVESYPDGEHEVRYQFSLGQHSRPNNKHTERIELDSLDFDSAGRLAWTSDGWTIEGLSIEWGPDVH